MKLFVSVALKFFIAQVNNSCICIVACCMLPHGDNEILDLSVFQSLSWTPGSSCVWPGCCSEHCSGSQPQGQINDTAIQQHIQFSTGVMIVSAIFSALFEDFLLLGSVVFPNDVKRAGSPFLTSRSLPMIVRESVDFVHCVKGPRTTSPIVTAGAVWVSKHVLPIATVEKSFA